MRTLVVLILVAALSLGFLLWSDSEKGKVGFAPEPGAATEVTPPVSPAAKPGEEPDVDRAQPPSAPREPGHTLAGRVTDDTGAPLSDFDVTAVAHPGILFLSTGLEHAVRESDGTFQLAELAAGEWSVGVSAEGHVARQARLFLPIDESAVFALQRIGTVSGVVRSSSGSSPHRATIRISPPPVDERGLRSLSPERSGKLGTTDAESRFRFPAAPGVVRLHASAPGFLDSDPIELSLAPGQVVEDLVLELGSGGAIEGRVHSLVGIREVRRIEVIGAEYEGRTIADPSGMFRLRGIPQGSYHVVAFPIRSEVQATFGVHQEMGELQLRRYAPVEVLDGETTWVEMEAAEFQPVRVSVAVTLDGHPAREHPFVLGQRGTLGFDGSVLPDSHPGDRFDEVFVDAHLDDEGHALLTALPGRWEAELGLEPDVSSNVLRFRAQIEAGVEHRITLDLRTGSIAGRALTSEGAPIERLGIEALGNVQAGVVEEWTRTDGSGAYRLDGLPVGEYVLRAAERVRFTPGALPTLESVSRSGVLVTAGGLSESIDFTLGPGGGVRLYPSPTDSRAPGVRLLLTGATAELDIPYLPAERCFFGTGLLPGRYEVSVADGTLEIEEPQWIDVVAGEFQDVGILFAEDG